MPLIHRLVALGLVERVTTASDKRKRLLVVTDKGKALYEQVKTVADDLREEILTAITPQEQEQPSGCWKSCCAKWRRNNAPSPITPTPRMTGRRMKPALLGSPSTPLHSPAKRLAYGVVGLLVCLTARWQQWSPPTCSCCRVPSPPVDRNRLAAGGIRDDQRLHHLLLVKFRQQFGLRAFTEGFLVLYVLVTFFHLFVNDLSSAMMVAPPTAWWTRRSARWGFTTGTGSPARHRLKGLTIGITGSSLATSARLFSTELLQTDEWRGLYFFERPALVSLACVIALKLPPSDRKKCSKKDFITFFCWRPAWRWCAPCCRWGGSSGFEAPDGWALAAAVILIVAAITFEHNRSNPCSIPNGSPAAASCVWA